jgi:hypothetical protein
LTNCPKKKGLSSADLVTYRSGRVALPRPFFLFAFRFEADNVLGSATFYSIAAGPTGWLAASKPTETPYATASRRGFPARCAETTRCLSRLHCLPARQTLASRSATCRGKADAGDTSTSRGIRWPAERGIDVRRALIGGHHVGRMDAQSRGPVQFTSAYLLLPFTLFGPTPVDVTDARCAPAVPDVFFRKRRILRNGMVFETIPARVISFARPHQSPQQPASCNSALLLTS